MKRILLILLLTLYVNPPQAKPLLLVLGDSLSAAYNIPADTGWVSLLQQHLENKGYRDAIINASVSGDTSKNALVRLTPLIATHAPTHAIVAIGGNDGLR